MLKELLNIFKKDTKLDQAFRRSYEMLDITLEMFLEAKRSLRETDSNEIATAIYERDKDINRYEREVRQFVFQHLAVAGTDDLTSSLVLISIIIDIERIGDYAKNMVELAMNHPTKLGSRYEEDLQKVEAAVEDTFVRVRNIFEKADENEAESLIKDYLWVNRLCDQRVIDYIREVDKTVTGGDAVTLALYFRYLKRINSHLRNIATSVCNPFDKIGFVSSQLKEKES